MNYENLQKANELNREIDNLTNVIDNLQKTDLHRATFTDFNHGYIRIPQSCVTVVKDLILAEYTRQLESKKEEFEKL